MITDLLSVGLMAFFAVLGLRQPYVALCGVIWIDLYKPQLLSMSFLADRPLSLIMTAVFALSMLLNIEKLRWPKHKLYTLIFAAFMGWITLTTYFAQFQAEAWFKWDAAFKTMLLAYFIPFALAKREHLELFLWTLVSTMGFFFFVAGVKSLFGGGGYGISLISDNPGIMWNEGSTLAAQAIAALPLLYYAGKHSLLKQRFPQLGLIMLGLGVAAVLVLVGTQARTGLITLFALILFTLMYSRSRGTIIAVCILAPLFAMPFMPQEWTERMTTMKNSQQESSAQGRVVVWRWTVDFANEHPVLGGGFYAYLANAGQLKNYAHEGEVVIDNPAGKAFHNIFFEVLGEHGYVGLAMYVVIVFHALLVGRRTYRRAENPEWLKSMALCTFVSTAVYCIGGLFIGIAFYPWLYYMYGLTVALSGANVAASAGAASESATGNQARKRPALPRAPASTPR